MKKIILDSCLQCPYIGRGGGFGRIAYIPRCGKVDRNLPYTEHAANGIIVASPTGIIPDWCPLEDSGERK